MMVYANRYGVGEQPGGPGTVWVFTFQDIMTIRNRQRPDSYKWEKVERKENREQLGLGPLYNKDGTPRP
jgi:hypothetical protein